MQLSFDLIRKKSTLFSLIALALFIVGYFPVFQLLVKLWLASDEYSHAFLTLPIIFYMVWRKWPVLAESQVRYSSAGILLLVDPHRVSAPGVIDGIERVGI